MDIYREWIDKDTRQTRARVYRNIDPDSIIINGGEILFAHPGAWHGALSANRYHIPVRDGCAYWTTDPVVIKKALEVANGSDHLVGECVADIPKPVLEEAYADEK